MADHPSGRAVLGTLPLSKGNPLRDFGHELHKLGELLDDEGHSAFRDHSVSSFADYRIHRAFRDYEEAAPSIESACRTEWAKFMQPAQEMESLFEMSDALEPPQRYITSADALIAATNKLLQQIGKIAKVWRKLAERLEGYHAGFYIEGTHKRVDWSKVYHVWAPKPHKKGEYVLVGGQPHAMTAPQHNLLHYFHKLRQKKKSPTIQELEDGFGKGWRTVMRRLEKKLDTKLIEKLEGYGTGYGLY